MNRKELAEYILATYGVCGDRPWMGSPEFVVYRHADNQKWFALVMDVPRSRLGLPGDGILDVVNLKCDPALVICLRDQDGFFPAYHMSKTNWVTVALDGSVDDDQLIALLDMSFDATATKTRRK
ncbi:MmcQ/YjbR family DNA-binding protein [Paratractidigestivibacter sp.]|uniref:MmcQ/YjbR family DNA-binding protein n=1 Tax=Paratractidigestivibacter sp. TaxID=2847316 RepID=UPI002ABDA49C|nr:MmcQ/YjbR family DNA-binding protein [Paratractidigestivibacter sp.]